MLSTQAVLVIPACMDCPDWQPRLGRQLFEPELSGSTARQPGWCLCCPLPLMMAEKRLQLHSLVHVYCLSAMLWL